MRYTAEVTVVTSLYKCGLDLDLGAQHVFPLVPGCMPNPCDKCGIDEHLQVSVRAAVERVVIGGTEFAWRRMEVPLPMLREEKPDPPDIESLAVTRATNRDANSSKIAK